MRREHAEGWEESGTRATSRAERPDLFIDQHVSPLFYRRTIANPAARDCKELVSEEEFWDPYRENVSVFRDVTLKGFRLSDWFPRAPGVYWSDGARRVRQRVYVEPVRTNAVLGDYVVPDGKRSLIEEGGIGTIRLRARRIDEKDCWFATALTGFHCHAGIPVVIPDGLLKEQGINWGDQVSLTGRVRNLQDAGLDDTAGAVHHARPLIVFVDELKGMATKRPRKPIVITPVALFDDEKERASGGYGRPRYTFVHCAAGADAELDAAADWIQKYATEFSGRVITNFDEQRPVLADAPLSYQRLVSKTFDRTVIEHFNGTLHAEQINQLIQKPITIGEIHMGHKIKVDGPAIINIDSVLKNVTQRIGTASGLKTAQKKKLETLVGSLRAELEKLNETHTDETKEVAVALEKAIETAAKPPEERKQSLLKLSAKGLIGAAELLKDVAPTVLSTAGLIAKFIVGLP